MKIKPRTIPATHFNQNSQQQLLQRLNYFHGHYECHITVTIPPNKQEALERFINVCHSLKAKPIVIVLNQGQTPTQPMLGKQLIGSPEWVHQEILDLEYTLAQQFEVTRVKVEVSPDTTNLPHNQDKATQLPESCYFEHHVKMLLPNTFDQTVLRKELEQYQGYLSRNAIAKHNDDYEYRFVTQRFRTSEAKAKQGLQDLLSYLEQQNITVTSTIREFNIFDSQADLDKGWMHDTLEHTHH